MIPKIIYQTWSTQNLPTKLEKLHNKMLKNNRGYQHIIYTDGQMNDYMNANADKDIKYLKVFFNVINLYLINLVKQVFF